MPDDVIRHPSDPADAKHSTPDQPDPAAKAPDAKALDAKAPDAEIPNGAQAPELDPNDARRAKARPWVWVGVAIVIGALAGGGTWYWQSTKDIETTDDAYTDGRAVTVAPQISGQVVTLDVTDNQFVHKGDVIVTIDPRQYRFARDQAAAALVEAQGLLDRQRSGLEIARRNFPAQLEQARARLAQAEAGLVKARADAQRQHSLQRDATSATEIDSANAAFATAQAQVLDAQAGVEAATPVAPRIAQADADLKQQSGQVGQAQARLDQAELNLSWTVVRAPQDGWITKRNVEIGSYVTPGQQLTALVSPEVWVTANFKENQLDRIRIGQRVRLRIDAYGSLRLEGHVDSVQLGSGTKFTAFPPENATGNFVKIVQRVPVKIVIDSGLAPGIHLPLGLSVAPTVMLK